MYDKIQLHYKQTKRFIEEQPDGLKGLEKKRNIFLGQISRQSTLQRKEAWQYSKSLQLLDWAIVNYSPNLNTQLEESRQREIQEENARLKEKIKATKEYNANLKKKQRTVAGKSGGSIYQSGDIFSFKQHGRGITGYKV